ncbi:MAG: phage protease, partial [Sphingorhabdus sp.]
DENFKDIAALASFLADMPKSSLGARIENKEPKRAATEITEEEKSIASMLGLSAEDYLKTRNEMEAA